MNIPVQLRRVIVVVPIETLLCHESVKFGWLIKMFSSSASQAIRDEGIARCGIQKYRPPGGRTYYDCNDKANTASSVMDGLTEFKNGGGHRRKRIFHDTRADRTRAKTLRRYDRATRRKSHDAHHTLVR